MPGIIEGCNYDIFISYCKRTISWIIEAVNHLKGELESTFKIILLLFR